MVAVGQAAVWMTKVPGDDASTCDCALPFTAVAWTDHRYEVQASSGDGTKTVSLTVIEKAGVLVAVLVTVMTYCHGPGGRVIAGLLQMNRGWSVNSTSLVVRMGWTSRSQLRTGCDVTVSATTLPPESSSRSTRKVPVLPTALRTRNGERNCDSVESSSVTVACSPPGGSVVALTSITGAGETLSAIDAMLIVIAWADARAAANPTSAAPARNAAARRPTVIPSSSPRRREPSPRRSSRRPTTHRAAAR